MGGLLPISSPRSRHCRWCRDSRGHGVHNRRPYMQDRGPVCPCACLGRPVATGFLRCFVAIEDSLSRQRWLTLCRNRDFSVETGSWVVTAFGVATQFWCRDKGAELLGWFVSRRSFYVVTVGRGQERQKSSVATDFSVFSIEVSLSRQSLPVWCRDTALWCCDRVGWLSDVTTERGRSSALNSTRSVLALCTRQSLR